MPLYSIFEKIIFGAIIGLFKLVPKLVDGLFAGVSHLQESAERRKSSTCAENEIEIYEPAEDVRNAD